MKLGELIDPRYHRFSRECEFQFPAEFQSLISRPYYKKNLFRSKLKEK